METDNNINLQFAHILPRLAAHILDVLISLIVTLLFVLYISNASTPFAVFDSILNSIILMVLLFAIIWHILLSYLESKFGGTPGKLLTGIRIVNIKNKYLSFKRALFRNFVGRTVASMFLGAGFFWIMKDKNNQGWHDLVTGSYVVTKSKNGLWLGLIFIILLALIMVFMINMIADNVSMHQNMYHSLLH